MTSSMLCRLFGHLLRASFCCCVQSESELQRAAILRLQSRVCHNWGVGARDLPNCLFLFCFGSTGENLEHERWFMFGCDSDWGKAVQK
ncbi:hypothetical protein DFJ73DRAFT_870925 [Zopfochytrium polystomum]|nr:hypothetical protein DFJ73DRAFT_870925 [Zopfochytrium polystomum]